MKIACFAGVFALLLTIVPPALFAAGMMADGPMKLLMLIGTALWFAAAPKWLRGGSN